MDSLGVAFVEKSRSYLLDEYLTKIERCLDQLSVEQIWWRPNAASNSIGNLILHLAGNARQWIVSGVGGAPDIRDRPSEFARREPLSVEVLKERLRKAFGEVDRTLGALDPATLGEHRSIQGYDVTLFEAIYHVVEHVSMHTGQITYLTKRFLDRDLDFYRVNGGLAMPNW